MRRIHFAVWCEQLKISMYSLTRRQALLQVTFSVNLRHPAPILLATNRSGWCVTGKVFRDSYSARCQVEFDRTVQRKTAVCWCCAKHASPTISALSSSRQQRTMTARSLCDEPRFATKVVQDIQKLVWYSSSVFASLPLSFEAAASTIASFGNIALQAELSTYFSRALGAPL